MIIHVKKKACLLKEPEKQTRSSVYKGMQSILPVPSQSIVSFQNFSIEAAVRSLEVSLRASGLTQPYGESSEENSILSGETNSLTEEQREQEDILKRKRACGQYHPKIQWKKKERRKDDVP